MNSNFLHQVTNIFVALLVWTGAVTNNLNLSVPFGGLWCMIDLYFVMKHIPPGSKRQSLIVHHLLSSLMSLLWITSSTLSKPTIEISRYICLVDVTTVFVCLHNIIQNEITKHFRNIIFAGMRGWYGLKILYALHTIDIELHNAVIFAGFVALCWAWLFGNTIFGRNASLINYFSSWITSVYFVEDPTHTLLVGLGVGGSYLFYEKFYKTPDRVIISAHLLYTLCVPVLGHGLLQAALSLWLCTIVYAVSPEETAKNLNNYFVSFVMIITLFIQPWSIITALMIASGIGMGIVLFVAGGPRQVSYGWRVVWHMCANGLMSSLMVIYK